MAKPKPVPGTLSSSRVPMAKALSISWADIPGPSSSTEISMRGPTRRADMRTDDLDHFKALSMRLASISSKSGFTQTTVHSRGKFSTERSRSG